jgi:cytochrome b561
MHPSTPAARHGPLTQALHWASAVLVISAFALGTQLEDWPRGPQRDWVMMIHYSLGTLVLALVVARLLRRAMAPMPPAPRGMSRLAVFAASAMHWVLYAAMVALPVTGAFDRWARGRRLAVFDIVVPPPFTVPGGRIWREIHEVLGYAIAALVVVHVAAALWHHFVERDGVLRRMLPERRPATGAAGEPALRPQG